MSEKPSPTAAPLPSGSLEQALKGDYTFTVFDILAEAWSKLPGNKGTIWLAIILYMIVALPITWVLKHFLDDGTFAQCLRFVVSSSVDMALVTGIFMVGVKIACNIEPQPDEVYAYIEHFIKLVVAYVLVNILNAIGFILLIVPGLYLMTTYSLSPLLIVDKKLGPWQAMETSRKALTHCWGRALGLIALYLLILVLSAVTVVGLIWTLPLGVMLTGVAYRNVFGYDPAAGQATGLTGGTASGT